MTLAVRCVSWSQLDSKISGPNQQEVRYGMLELAIFIVAYFVLVNVVFPRLGIRPG